MCGEQIEGGRIGGVPTEREGESDTTQCDDVGKCSRLGMKMR